MGTIYYSKTIPGSSILGECRDLRSTNSIKLSGQWIMRPQGLTDFHNRVTQWKIVNAEFTPRSASFNSLQSEAGVNWAPIENRLAAKFTGKIKYDRASLGVTAFTWRSSLDMITKRLTDARGVLKVGERNLKRRLELDQKVRRHRRGQKNFRERPRWDEETSSANTILEVEFGWKALYQDLASAFNVLGGDIPDSFVTVRHKVWLSRETVTGGGVSPFDPLRSEFFSGYALGTYSAKVEVSNHNVFLLNKLGLINPLPALVDAIPWSFLVSMVSNINQLIGSISNTAGLSISDQNVTKTSHIACESFCKFRTVSNGPYFTNRSVVKAKLKTRTIGTQPKVTFEARLPELNLETAAIAAGLLVQQVARVSKLITLLSKTSTRI